MQLDCSMTAIPASPLPALSPWCPYRPTPSETTRSPLDTPLDHPWRLQERAIPIEMDKQCSVENKSMNDIDQ